MSADRIVVRRGYKRAAAMPGELLDKSTSHVGHVACRLWGLLDTYAGRGGASPSRSTIAAALECSTDTVDRSVRELEAHGWLEVERRAGRAGERNESSIYTLLHAGDGRTDAARDGRTDAARDGRTDAARDGRTGAARSKEPLKDTPPSPPTGGNLPAKVGRKSVTEQEGRIALAVLGEFNAQAGTSFTAVDHLRAIIGRVREHPEHFGDVEAQARLIRANLAEPWWKGPPSPAVIYGNAGVYEQAVERAKRAKATNPTAMLSDAERAERRAAADRREAEQVQAALDEWYAQNPDVPDPRTQEAPR